MLDFRAVAVSGAVNISRARAVWHEGTLKLFGKGGRVIAMQSEAPAVRSGWRRVWDVETEFGSVTLTARCMTCGGWWRVALKDAETLWHGNQG